MPYSSTGNDQIIAVRKLQHKCRIQVPREIRDALQIQDGDTIFWIKTIDGKFAIVKALKI